MKKKIINGLLMMALVVATTSSFVSCQDTVGDDYARLDEQNTVLKTILLQKIQLLEADLSKIKNLDKGGYLGEEEFTTKYKDLLDILEPFRNATYDIPAGSGVGSTKSLSEWIDGVNKMIQDLYGTSGSTVAALQDIISRLTALEGKAHDQVDLTDIISRLTALEGKAHDQVDLSDIISRLTALEEKPGAEPFDPTPIITRLETVESTLRTQGEQLNVLKESVESLQTQLSGKADQADLLALTNTVNTLSTTLQNQLADLKAKFDNYYTKEEVDAKKQEVDGLIASLNEHQIVVDGWLKNLSDSMRTAYTKIADAEGRILALETNSATKQELKDSVDKMRGEIVAAQQAAQEYADGLVDALRQEMKDSVSAVRTTLGDMQKDIQNLKEDVADLKDKMTKLEDRVTKLEERVTVLEEKVNKIFKAQALQVTGIIVQGAYSPVFGIGKLPIGVQTNILAAYYGRFYKDVTFPAFESTNYVNESDCFTAEEAAVIAGIQPEDIKAGIVLRDADDNAGTLYLTVNPNTVDFTGKLITLENSQGVAAPVTLTPLEKSDYLMNIGYTRAADNGFYEAKAKISQNDLAKAQARVDVEQLKTVAKDLYKNHNKSSIVDAASALYTTVSDVLDAQAAKATYVGLDENGNEQEKSVFSEYGLAVTAITPLSYNTLKNWHPTRIPGFNIAEKYINKLFDNINIKIDLGTKNLVTPTISHIDIKPFDELSDKWTVKVTIPSVTVNSEPVMVNIDVNGDVYFNEHWDDANDEPKVNPSTGEKYKADGHLTINQEVGPVTVNAKTNEITVYPDIKEQLRLVYDAFAEPLSDVNTTLDNLQDFVEQLNNVLENVNNLDKKIADAKNDARDKVISYLNKIEQKILSKASYVNQALQPVLLVQSGNGYKLLSKMEKYPSVAPETTLSLYATSYNIELLTPAYKKYAVCTGAWKADGTFDAEEAKAVNAAGYENFGKVIDGTEHKVTFTGKAGYKYRIVFQALDYHGKIASTRYYVQF